MDRYQQVLDVKVDGKKKTPEVAEDDHSSLES